MSKVGNQWRQKISGCLGQETTAKGQGISFGGVDKNALKLGCGEDCKIMRIY